MVENPPTKAGDARDAHSNPGLGRSPREGNDNPLQYSCLGNPMGRGNRWATVHGVAKSCTQPSTALEKEMAPHSSTLAWRIPWTEEPGGLLSIGVAQSRTRLKRLSMPACIGEGNGNPLQCSCLENPGDRGAWWAAIYGVTQSRT